MVFTSFYLAFVGPAIFFVVGSADLAWVPITSALLSKLDYLLCCCMVVRCRVRVTIVAIGVGAL